MTTEPSEPQRFADSAAPAETNGNGNRRHATALRFKPDVYERLVAAADERDLSINYLVNRAVEQFLDRLIPLEDMKWTR